MRTHSRQLTKTPLKLLLAVTAISLGALVQSTDAGVVWLASDDGTTLTLTSTGSLSVSGLSVSSADNAVGGAWNGTLNSIQSSNGQYYWDTSAGTGSTPGPFLATGISVATSVSGDSFGTWFGSLYWDAALGTAPVTITPDTTLTFAGQTVASTFGTNLDGGSVTMWTHGGTGDTVSIALAPEPSTAMLLGLSIFAAGVARRRRHS